MTMTSPFADNTTYQIMQVDETQTLLGYLFASRPLTVRPGVDQQQRWILHPAYFEYLKGIPRDSPVPVTDFMSLRIPSLEHRYTSLSAWIDAVRRPVSDSSLWQDCSMYVKVNSKNYDHIPTASDRTPPVPTLTGTGECQGGQTFRWKPINQVIDDRIAEIYRMMGGGDVELQGHVGGGTLRPITEGSPIRENTEYWVTYPGYLNDVSGDIQRLRFHKMRWIKGEDGEDDPALAYVTREFDSGRTFTVAKCIYLPQGAFPDDP
jgi:hypothetical protein